MKYGDHAFGVINADPEVLTDYSIILQAMLEACKKNNLTSLGYMHHTFPYPGGVSVNIMLSESHFTIHTWPEHGSATVDCFTCGENNPFDTVATFCGLINATAEKIEVMQR